MDLSNELMKPLEADLGLDTGTVTELTGVLIPNMPRGIRWNIYIYVKLFVSRISIPKVTTWTLIFCGRRYFFMHIYEEFDNALRQR